MSSTWPCNDTACRRRRSASDQPTDNSLVGWSVRSVAPADPVRPRSAVWLRRNVAALQYHEYGPNVICRVHIDVASKYIRNDVSGQYRLAVCEDQAACASVRPSAHPSVFLCSLLAVTTRRVIARPTVCHSVRLSVCLCSPSCCLSFYRARRAVCLPPVRPCVVSLFLTRRKYCYRARRRLCLAARLGLVKTMR